MIPRYVEVVGRVSAKAHLLLRSQLFLTISLYYINIRIEIETAIPHHQGRHPTTSSSPATMADHGHEEDSDEADESSSPENKDSNADTRDNYRDKPISESATAATPITATTATHQIQHASGDTPARKPENGKTTEVKGKGIPEEAMSKKVKRNSFSPRMKEKGAGMCPWADCDGRDCPHRHKRCVICHEKNRRVCKIPPEDVGRVDPCPRDLRKKPCEDCRKSKIKCIHET